MMNDDEEEDNFESLIIIFLIFFAFNEIASMYILMGVGRYRKYGRREEDEDFGSWVIVHRSTFKVIGLGIN